jgi:hypothetical protein
MLRMASHRATRCVLAVVLLGVTKIVMRCGPARTLRAFHRSVSPTTDDAPDPDSLRVHALRRLASSIDGASRLMSGTCLETAVASCVAARLLRVPVRLRIGVDEVRPGLRAHSWVECAGMVLVGGTPMAPLDR